MQHIVIHKLNIGTELNSVNARELHEAIQSKQQFTDWIKNRLLKYGFIENQDYIKITTKVGNATAYDYFITLDVAKELCMVENNEKGREARRYFIEAEKQLLNQPDLKKILNQLETQNQEIQNLKNQLSSKQPQKPKNPFAGYYESRDRNLGQRENEFAYTRNDWMMLLNECETQLALERNGKSKTLLLSRGAK